MKKRLVSMLLVSVLAISALTGCQEKEDSAKKEVYHATMPTGVEEAEIFVQPIENLAEDFIKGMDVSSVIVEEESGVKYYDEEGKEQDLFRILADAGVNYIRVRVWNHPYDENGNGYGGGNNDVEKAAEIGRRAAENGMKLLVDFHYSDFWADPKKQFCPVEWRGTEPEEKAQLLSEFTKNSLNQILEAGADVGMVQIGNEINNAMSSEHETEDIMTLLDAASKAVRSVAEEKNQDIQIAVHYTEIDDYNGTIQKAQNLKDANIDYDIFGVSYYPYWHGTMENMNKVLKDIADQFDKKTCVLETSYAYTNEDGDQYGNSVSEGDLVDGYPATVQGQASCIRDIMAQASDAGAIGVFYWEGAWIPVGTDYESNQKIWEKKGSGWASSYASVYDSQDAGKYYGGCSWDNQAMFDFEGRALPSLNVFKWVNYGASAPLKVMSYPEIYMEIGVGDLLTMPLSVDAFYNDPSVNDPVAVTWDEEQFGAIDTNIADTYTVDGTTAAGDTVTATIKVCNINYVKNPGFDEEDMSVWTINDDNGATDVQDKASDALSGTKAFHFYSESDLAFSVEQKLEIPGDGIYTASVNLQGGDLGDQSDIYLYVKVNGTEYKSDGVVLDGWCNWKNPQVTDISIDSGDEVIVGVYVSGAAKGWGTIDDFEFFSTQAQ